MRILIVDDESHVCEGLQMMIDWQALEVCQVDTAANGMEAWALFQQNKPDLLLTDVAMPRMNGLQLAEKVRQADPDIPIIFLSGYDDFEYAREAIHLHVSRYILKPTIYSEIQEVVCEVLDEVKAFRKQEKYMKEFYEQVKHNLPFLREQFLFDLLTATRQESRIYDSQLQFYQLDPGILQGGLVASLMLFRSGNERVAAEKDWQLFKYSAMNIAQEIVASQPGENYVLRFVGDRLIILFAGSSRDTVTAIARATARQIVKNIMVYLGIDVNVGIGRWYEADSDYALSFKESWEVLQYLEYEEDQRVLSIDELKQPAAGWTEYPAEQARLLADAIQNRDITETMKVWRKMEARLLNPDTTIVFVQVSCVAALSRLILELGTADEAFADPQTMLVAVPDIFRCASKESVLELFAETLQKLVETAKLQDGVSQHTGHIQKVLQYIEEHYQESISFADLAKQLYVTRNYLSYLFKRETGESFVAYLTRYRIERSKELIKANQYKIYEVSEKVGYADPAYFSRVFKNVTGISPLEYAQS